MSSVTTTLKTQEIDLTKALPTAPSGSKFIVLPESGFTLRYADTRSGDCVDDSEEVTFLLLHGFAGILETWDILTPYLLKGARNYRVVAPDLVGSGYSDKPERTKFDYSNRSQGIIVSEFISVLSLKRVVLVGHSTGTVVAAATAVQARTNEDDENVVAGSVFVANALFRQKPPFYTDRSKEPVFRQMLGNMMSDRGASMATKHLPVHADRVLTKDFVEAFDSPSRLPNFYDALVESVMAKEAPYEDLVDEMLSSQPGRTIVPMLFVSGSEDSENPLPEEQKESMRQKLDAMDAELREQQRIETVTLENCSHYPQHEQPEALAKEILSFVGKSVTLS